MSLKSSELTPLERCNQYARDVLSGAICACQKDKLAAQRYFDDLTKIDDPEYPWTFDPERAERPVLFIEKFLAPSKGDYERMVLMPWQCFVECNLYGWIDKQIGKRRYREALILVGTGNGKSTMVSGNATYMCCKDGERGADVYLLANSKDQAGNVFNECHAGIKSSRQLSGHFRVLRDGVYYDLTASKIMARSSDSKKLDGLNPHLAVFDEIHEYRDFKLIDVIKRKIVKRTQPLVLYITTMGTVLDGPLAYYYGLFSDALVPGKLDQRIADRMFTFICELDPEDDVNDSSLWIKANPSLGTLLKLEDLEDTWNRDKLIPAQRADFITKQLNIMVNADEMQYMPPEILLRNNRIIDDSQLIGRACYGGFDLSTREDHTAAALEFNLDDGSVYTICHAWVPRAKVEINREKLDYYSLAMRGYLTIVEGEYVQQEDVYQWFCEMNEKYEIVTIGYDPANATKLTQMLEGKGFNLKVVRQGPLTLNEPMKDLKERFIDGNVVSNNDPLFMWYTDNVRISGEKRHADKENWMPMKRNKFRKIDGFMAFLFAHTVNMWENPAYGSAEISFTSYDFNF